MFEISTRPMNMLEIVGKIRSGKLRFDLEIQRRFCWRIEKQQKLIDSLIFGYRVPEISIVNKNDDYIWCLDGGQRTRSIEGFYSDKYSLADDTRDFEDYEGNKYKIAGLKYSELPENVKKILDSRTITACKYSNATDEEISEQFRRLNNGEPMKKIEITRVDAGTEVMRFINDVSNMEFFKAKVNISNKARIHFTDHEVILQTMALITEADIGFSGKELQQLAVSFKANGLPDEVKNDMLDTTNYLNEVFPEKCKYLKKANIPVMFYVANYARKNNIDAVDFFDWVNTFYTELDPNSRYAETYSNGSAKRDNVQRRLKILLDEFKKFMDKTSNSTHAVKPLLDDESFYEAEDSISFMNNIPHNIVNAIQGSY